MAVVDLHLHTTASDGRLSPTELVNLLVKSGIKFAAITDHDSTEGLDEALAATEEYSDFTLIPGIELSAVVPGDEIHMLGYFIRRENENLQQTLKRFRNGRIDRAEEMVGKLRELGVRVEWERVLELAGDGAVGRPHIALAMVERGYIKEPKEAFTNYIGRNGPAYAERDRLSPEDSIALIEEAGGVAVLAHPAYMEEPQRYLQRLKEAGLVGMEVYYAKYDEETITMLAELAARYELLACGGSDYHGMGTPDEPLPGLMGPPPQIVQELRSSALKKHGPAEGAGDLVAH